MQNIYYLNICKDNNYNFKNKTEIPLTDIQGFKYTKDINEIEITFHQGVFRSGFYIITILGKELIYFAKHAGLNNYGRFVLNKKATIIYYWYKQDWGYYNWRLKYSANVQTTALNFLYQYDPHLENLYFGNNIVRTLPDFSNFEPEGQIQKLEDLFFNSSGLGLWGLTCKRDISNGWLNFYNGIKFFNQAGNVINPDITTLYAIVRTKPEGGIYYVPVFFLEGNGATSENIQYKIIYNPLVNSFVCYNNLTDLQGWINEPGFLNNYEYIGIFNGPSIGYMESYDVLKKINYKLGGIIMFAGIITAIPPLIFNNLQLPVRSGSGTAGGDGYIISALNATINNLEIPARLIYTDNYKQCIIYRLKTQPYRLNKLLFSEGITTYIDKDFSINWGQDIGFQLTNTYQKDLAQLKNSYNTGMINNIFSMTPVKFISDSITLGSNLNNASISSSVGLESITMESYKVFEMNYTPRGVKSIVYHFLLPVISNYINAPNSQILAPQRYLPYRRVNTLTTGIHNLNNYLVYNNTNFFQSDNKPSPNSLSRLSINMWDDENEVFLDLLYKGFYLNNG